jgi:hypothetical protein
VNGDMAIEGNIRFTHEGVERARLTSEGNLITFDTNGGQQYVNGLLEQPEQPTQEYNHYDRPLTTEDQLRIIRELASEINGEDVPGPVPQKQRTEVDLQHLYNELNEVRFDRDEPAEDARWRLEQTMASQLAEANERVAEKHLSLLDNIELGTVEQRMIDRMQRLAGIQTREQRLAELDAERARIEQQARRNGEEAAEQARIEREALLEQINIDMAEQSVVPSNQRKNIWNQIKSLWSK